MLTQKEVQQLDEQYIAHTYARYAVPLAQGSGAQCRDFDGKTYIDFGSGIGVNARVNKDLFAGIARVKSYLKGENGVPKLYIFEGCVNLIRELKGYFWGEGDVPKKRDDHALDELRYYLMSRPHADPPAKPLSAIQKDKAKLARRKKPY